MKKLLSALSIILIAFAVGCVALSESLTPATIDQRAVEYVVESGVAQPEEFAGYGNLHKARRLEALVTAAHQTNQFAFQKLSEGDLLTYTQLNQIAVHNRQQAAALEASIFSGEGLLPLLAGMAGAGTLTGLIGLMRKRPGDITPEEMEQAIADVKGKTVEELTEKDKQILELVQSVAAIFKNLDTAKQQEIKTVLNGIQDTSTQNAVDALKNQYNIT